MEKQVKGRLRLEFGSRILGPNEVHDTPSLSLVASLTGSYYKANATAATLALSVLGTTGRAAGTAVREAWLSGDRGARLGLGKAQ